MLGLNKFICWHHSFQFIPRHQNFSKKKQEISSSYLGIMQNLKKDSRKENFKIFQKKSRKYLVHIQASCKINYSHVTLYSRKENYKHQFCRFRHKKTTQYRSGIFANSYKIPSKKPNSQCPSGRSRETICRITWLFFTKLQEFTSFYGCWSIEIKSYHN